MINPPDLYDKILNEDATAKDFIDFAMIFMLSRKDVDNDKLLEKYRKESKCSKILRKRKKK